MYGFSQATSRGPKRVHQERYKDKKKLDKGEAFVMYKCPRGLVDASSPISIDGEHVANVISGQVFLEPPDNAKEQFFRAQAREFGFDEIEYILAFRKVPVFTEKKFRSALFFLAKLAQMIAKMVYILLNELESAKALQESEGRLKSLFEESADAVLIYRDGLLVDCNQAAVDMLRLETRKQFLNCTLADISPEYQPDGCRSKIKSVEMVELATTQGNHRFEWTHMRQLNSTFSANALHSAGEFSIEIKMNETFLIINFCLFMLFDYNIHDSRI